MDDLLELEVHYEGYMVGRNERRFRSMQRDMLDFQLRIVVHVIEVHDRENGGIRTLPSEIYTNIRTLELGRESTRHVTTRPLIEIAEHHSRSFKASAAKDGFVDEPARLLAAFKEVRAEVYVEQVKRPCVQEHVRAETTSFLVSHDANVVIAMGAKRVFAQDQISVRIAHQLAVLSKRGVQAQFTGETLSLCAEDLLERDHVGI